ncbi:hypothetical protein CCP2SC5_1160009 [Azospirillaceae bacterium]
MAIRPYPSEMEEVITLADGRPVLLRPIRPEDAPAYERMIRRLDVEDMRMRFFGIFKTVPRSQLTSLIHIDYDRDMSLIATEASQDDPSSEVEILGMVNIVGLLAHGAGRICGDGSFRPENARLGTGFDEQNDSTCARLWFENDHRVGSQRQSVDDSHVSETWFPCAFDD